MQIISRPAGLEQRAYLLDARLPDAENVLVGALVRAAERAVSEVVAQGTRATGAHPGQIERRLLLRHRDSGKPRPREVLHPGGMRGRLELADDLRRPRADPPVVEDRLRIGAGAHPFGRSLAR